jgi:hypothetical protein
MCSWREGYSHVTEQQPALTVTANQLETPAATVEAWTLTNSYSEDLRSFIAAGLRVLTPGCWEITGDSGDHRLTIVVWIAVA